MCVRVCRHVYVRACVCVRAQSSGIPESQQRRSSSFPDEWLVPREGVHLDLHSVACVKRGTGKRLSSV